MPAPAAPEMAEMEEFVHEPDLEEVPRTGSPMATMPVLKPAFWASWPSTPKTRPSSSLKSG